MDRNIGKKLDGRYEITELIGIGGMADVYKATDIIDDKVVAVKILKNEFSGNEEFLRRFRNESKAIAVLSHPNIVKIYDVGFSEKIQFIVMEYIDGITLKEFIEQQGILKWKDAVHFTIQILRALQHAHDRGIVHRDIKPQNIMLFPDGTIKVMDFGIARFAREEGKTISDKAIGSVHYISPEQARGDVTDEKSDIYSVGIMMYEMLTGKKPFDGENPVAIAVMHMENEVKPLRDVNGTIPEGLAEIVMRATQKEASKRYQSASEMIKDIEQFKKNPSIVFEYKYLTPAVETTRYFDPIPAKKAEPKKVKPPVKEKPKKEPVRKKQEEPEYIEEEDDEEYEDKPSLLIPILSAVAAAVIIIAALFITVLLVTKLGGNNAQSEAFPNLVGVYYSDAKALYQDQLSLFEIKVDTQEYNDYPEGVIFWQSVEVGKEFIKGSNMTVTVKVSKGPRMSYVPDVYGYDPTTAQTLIRQQDLEPNIQYANSEDVPKDYVISTSPERNAMINAGKVVTIFVSLGPEEVDVIVPDVVLKSIEDAKKELDGKLAYVIEEVNSLEPKDTVVEQSIPALAEDGTPTIVKSRTEIILKVSNGEPPQETATVRFGVPNSAKGAFTIVMYNSDGMKCGEKTIDNIAYVTSIEVEVTGGGVQPVFAEAICKANGLSRNFAEFSVDFSTGTATEVTFDASAFRELSSGIGDNAYAVTTTPSVFVPWEQTTPNGGAAPFDPYLMLPGATTSVSEAPVTTAYDFWGNQFN